MLCVPLEKLVILPAAKRLLWNSEVWVGKIPYNFMSIFFVVFIQFKEMYERLSEHHYHL